MRRSVLAFLAVPCFSAAFSQAPVPNGGFENWTSYGTYDDPTGWTSLNIISAGLGGVLTCERVTPGASGSAAVKVITRDVPGFGLIAGLLIAGAPDAASEGFPYTTRPATLNGQWKATIAPTDIGAIAVSLSKWDNVAGERLEVGTGFLEVSGTVQNWTAFSIPILYDSPVTPDTASIAILSSLDDGVAGSALWVDALAFSTQTVGLAEQVIDNVQVFPVPASTHITFQADAPVQSAELWSVDGRSVATQQPMAQRATLDLRSVPAGSYVLVLRTADGRVARRSIVKQ